MPKENFFENQSDSTAVKLNFYQNYIEGYLIKILMQFGCCIIADLFCGPGKNGNKDGSPLILIEKSKKIINNTLLLKYRSPKIFVIFNDNDKNNIEKLKLELSKQKDLPSNIILAPPRGENYSEVLEKIIKIGAKIPRFFFLDPFTYSIIPIGDIKKIMDIPFSEVLLFIPTFSAYRFSNSKNNPSKLKKFLSNFTDKGEYDYKNIYDFNESIRRKLMKELKLNYARYILIDAGKTKNSLLFLTRNIKGLMLINNIFLKETYDGKSLNVKNIKHCEKSPSLFPKCQIETQEFKRNIISFQDKLICELKSKKEMKNTKIIDFTVIEGYKPSYAVEVLKRLKKDGCIDVDYLSNKNKGFYVSEDNYNKELCIIRYL